MTQEALKLALDALIWTTGSGDFGEGGYAHEGAKKCLFPAITAIKEALAQTQEPVAYLTRRKIGGTEGLLRADMVDKSAKNQETHDFIPLYTAPPQRTWVGLDEKDFSAINQSCLTKLQAATSAESILKEKNT